MSDEQNIAIYHHFLANVFPSLQKAPQLARYAAQAELHNSLNPIAQRGAKVYSQNDEDGITFEILRRLNIDKGTFAEFGVGDGKENNTLALAALGWKGFWVGNQDLAFDPNPKHAVNCAFHYEKAWITRSNIEQLYLSGLASIGATSCELISLDLDGNDYYFVSELLNAGATPEVFIVEYNAKFIPPIRFVIDYDEQHSWNGSDYFGASLSSFVDLFAAHGYFLTCCNITGANAFFVKEKYRGQFSDIPERHDLIYASPKYFLTGLDVSGHPVSIKAIESIFHKLHALHAAT